MDVIRLCYACLNIFKSKFSKFLESPVGPVVLKKPNIKSSMHIQPGRKFLNSFFMSILFATSEIISFLKCRITRNNTQLTLIFTQRYTPTVLDEHGQIWQGIPKFVQNDQKNLQKFPGKHPQFQNSCKSTCSRGHSVEAGGYNRLSQEMIQPYWYAPTNIQGKLDIPKIVRVRHKA